MVEDADVRNYKPTFVIDARSVMQYVDAPLLADATNRGAVAPAVLSLLAEPSHISPSVQANTQAD
jgi:hypothetical protein